MIASTQMINTEIFAFIAVLVIKLLSHKVMILNIKDDRNCYKNNRNCCSSSSCNFLWVLVRTILLVVS